MKLKKLACVAMVSLMSTGLVACGSENNSTGNKSSEGETTLSQAESKTEVFVEEPDTAPYEEYETNEQGYVVKGSDLRVIYNLKDYPASFWDAQNKYTEVSNRREAQANYEKKLGKESGILTPQYKEYSTYRNVNGVGYKLTLKPEDYLYMNALEENNESEAIEMHVLLNDCTFSEVRIALTTVKENRFEEEFGKVDDQVEGWTLHNTDGCPILVKKLNTKSGVITVLTIELNGNVSGNSMQILRQSRCIELVKKVKECVTIEMLDYTPKIDYIDVKDMDESAIKISDKVTVAVPEEFKIVNWCRDKGYNSLVAGGYGGRNIIVFQKLDEFTLIHITEVPDYFKKTIEDIKSEEEQKGKVLTDVSSGGVKMYECYRELNDGNSKSYERIIEANGAVYVVLYEVLSCKAYPETAAKFDEVCKSLIKIN